MKNTGSSPTAGWRVRWAFPGGQSVSQLWNGNLSTTGGLTVTDLGWNGGIAPNATTTFGFLGSGDGDSSTPSSLTCTVS